MKSKHKIDDILRDEHGLRGLVYFLDKEGLLQPGAVDVKYEMHLDPMKRAETPAWKNLRDEAWRMIHSTEGGYETPKRLDALNYTLANLAVSAISHGPVVRYSRHHSKDTEGLAPLKYVIDGLVKHRFADNRLGGYHVDSGRAYKSMLVPGPRLLDFMAKYGADGWDVSTSRTVDPIVLKDEHKMKMEVPPEKTVSMVENIKIINGMLESAQVRLGDYMLAGAFPARVNRKEQFRRKPYDITRRTLYRVFSRGRLDRNGRFFGHWAQQIPSRYRKFIIMNGEPAAEVDFAGMHINMLYAMEHLPMPSCDVYELPGHERRFCKIVMNSLINAKDEAAAVRGAAHRARGEDIPVRHGETREILDALKKRHLPLAKFFSNDSGVLLMYHESQIAERVMLNLHRKGIPSLPVHDSFLVPRSGKDALVDEMKASFRAQLGVEPKVVVEVG